MHTHYMPRKIQHPKSTLVWENLVTGYTVINAKFGGERLNEVGDAVEA